MYAMLNNGNSELTLDRLRSLWNAIGNNYTQEVEVSGIERTTYSELAPRIVDNILDSRNMRDIDAWAELAGSAGFDTLPATHTGATWRVSELEQARRSGRCLQGKCSHAIPC